MTLKIKTLKETFVIRITPPTFQVVQEEDGRQVFSWRRYENWSACMKGIPSILEYIKNRLTKVGIIS